MESKGIRDVKERKKRKSVEAECQRMTHIVVERNRRRLMNEHLAKLRSLMPSSFVQRGDQASIIGGAIDFIKELEQMILYFQAGKSFSVSSRCTGFSSKLQRGDEDEESEVDVEVTAVQGHVNLKVTGRRRPGQIVRALAAMEELGLTVLHLSITSLDDVSVFYSLNVKMEEDCKLGSADEIVPAVHQIFNTC